MRQFSEIINEAKSLQLSSQSLKNIKQDVNKFIKQMSSKLDDDIRALCILFDKYNIYNKEVVYKFLNGSKSEIKSIRQEFNIDYDDLNNIIFLLKKINKNNKTRMIPIVMTKDEREDLLNGTKHEDDIIIDLETERGRNKIAQQMMPLVIKIAQRYVGRTPMSKTDLISSGTEGLANAINNYRKPETNDIDNLKLDDEDKHNLLKNKHESFKKYAYYRILYQILNDINKTSHTVTISNYYYKKNNEIDPSLNFNKKIDDLNYDKMIELSNTPSVYKDDNQDAVSMIVKSIEKRFNNKKCEIFYRIMGINGRERVKARTIADDLGVPEEQISRTKREILTYIKTNDKLMNALRDVLDLYTESILCDIYSFGKEYIIERLINDETYVLLEEMTKFYNKQTFINNLNNALTSISNEDADFIVNCLKQGFDFLDKSYNDEDKKQIIITFLTYLEPTVNYNMRADIFYLNRMNDIIKLCEKYKIYN